MRLAGLRSVLLGAAALLSMAAFSACENPFDPLNTTDKIEGLAYVDFSATWDRWDADADYDGMLITMDYYNEFGDSLSFHDKPHNVVVEFWTQEDIGESPETYFSQKELFFSTTVEYSNSEDDIRIPIESYVNLFPENPNAPGVGEAVGFVVIRVFPPKEYPRTELTVADADVTLYKPPDAEGVPNN